MQTFSLTFSVENINMFRIFQLCTFSVGKKIYVQVVSSQNFFWKNLFLCDIVH